MVWKKSYEEGCINALQPSGDVLEIGFGDGHAAKRIDAFHPTSHLIVATQAKELALARDFAARRPQVKVIEGSWRLALGTLGKFDNIFFHGESLTTKRSSERFASLLVKAGQKLLANTAKKFSQLMVMRYSDEDLAYFLKKVEKKRDEDKKMVFRFFAELYERGQITQLQWERASAELQERGWAKEEDVTRVESLVKGSLSSTDELLELIEICLEKHMKKGARFTCTLNDSDSKYEDAHFMNKIIENPSLDYTERWMEEHPQRRGLIMTITKQV